jgi:regulatory protein YycH of two-component signal transduction system YycFG
MRFRPDESVTNTNKERAMKKVTLPKTTAYEITIKGFMVYQPMSNSSSDTVYHMEVEDLFNAMMQTGAYPDVEIVELVPRKGDQ